MYGTIKKTRLFKLCNNLSSKGVSMDQEKFGKLIKEIRKKNNLTQNDLATKYNVTYQAVSKWENGKNMPDMALIKQISNDFNISLEEMLDVPKKNKKPLLLIISNI